MKSFLTAICFLSAITAATPSAFSAGLRILDGNPADTVVIEDNSPQDLNPDVGAVAFSGPVGTNWVVTIASGITKPDGGDAFHPTMDLETVDRSGKGGTLTIEFTDTNYIADGMLAAGIGGTGSGASVSMQVWVDPLNAPFGTNILAANLGPISGTANVNTNLPVVVTAPYSITLVTIINASAGGRASYDAEFILTPTPAKPSCPPDVTIECSDSQSPTNPVVGMPTLNDSTNCLPVNATYADTITMGTNCPVDHLFETIARTWTLTDSCNNTSTCVQLIFVTDTNAPAFVKHPGDIDLHCNPASIPTGDLSLVAAVDDCSPPTITSSFSDAVGGCTHIRTITYTATDSCGNSSSVTQKITWTVDTTPPTITCPDSITVTQEQGVPPPNPTLVMAMDTCSTPVVTWAGDVTNGTCPEVITRTYVAIDECGNSNSCVQTITVVGGGEIGNFVWNDLNGNGCQDAGEPGIAAVQVDLYSGCGLTGTLIESTTTDTNGFYLFTNLCTGTYTVSFNTPAGFGRTVANAGCVDTNLPAFENQLDSKCACSPGTPCGICVTLTVANPVTLNVDCGYVRLPTATCVTINAVQGKPITPVTMVGSGGCSGPYTFSATGLPTGLTMSTTGTISGTPTVNGTFNYTVTITDSCGNTGTLNCSVTVLTPPSATCVAINAVQGKPITPVTMVGSGGCGGPYTFSATGLPGNLTMSTNGTISGTPTNSGTFNYTVTITDSCGNTGTLNCSVTVLTPPSATCVTINAVQGKPITPVTMVGSGGCGGPYTFSATGLPGNLTMSTNGTISGTPTNSGTFNYTVTIKDSCGNTGTLNCSVTVLTPPSATCVTINAIQGKPITPVTMVGSGGCGGPYTFSATGLPPNLTMASNGTISGTPTNSGTFSYTVTITDSCGNTGTLNCSVTVLTPPGANCVTIIAVQGSPITPVTMVGSGGCGGPYTFTATGLPTGLMMATNGTISGTPSVSGTFNYTVTITDSCGNKGTLNCSVTVATACACDPHDIQYNFNGTQIIFQSTSGGSYVWFISDGTVKLPSSTKTNPAVLHITGQTITIPGTTNGGMSNPQIIVPVPDAFITFSNGVTTATATFDTVNNVWRMTYPTSSLAGNIFFGAAAFKVPAAGLPAGIKNVEWNGTFTSNTQGLSMSWQWSAANYTDFTSDYNSIAPKPTDDNNASIYKNSDHAGTPEGTNSVSGKAWKLLVTGGGSGGGGSNYTGSGSSTISFTPCFCP